MTPDPTVTISWDYLVELSDDGMLPVHPEPEVILMPPAPAGTTPTPGPAIPPAQGPQQ